MSHHLSLPQIITGSRRGCRWGSSGLSLLLWQEGNSTPCLTCLQDRTCLLLEDLLVTPCWPSLGPSWTRKQVTLQNYSECICRSIVWANPCVYTCADRRSSLVGSLGVVLLLNNETGEIRPGSLLPCTWLVLPVRELRAKYVLNAKNCKFSSPWWQYFVPIYKAACS